MTAMPESRVFQLCRNLLDAGCDAPLIERFLALEQAGEREEQRRLLARHKVCLLYTSIFCEIFPPRQPFRPFHRL